VTTLLHISASPRGAASESLALAATFLEAYRAAHPEARIETFDLWDGSLAAFGPAAAAAKMTIFAGGHPAGEQAAAWQAAQDTFQRFNAAERYLFSVPMWNAGIPYILKQFIDVVSQPGMVFGFDPLHGYTGLLSGKKVAVIYTSAVYGPGRGHAFGEDYQAPFFEDWLRWAGVVDITAIHFRPNLATADAESGRRAAHVQARAAGATFDPPERDLLHRQPEPVLEHR
jgi:FMN-dependent NADH-azoreductase